MRAIRRKGGRMVSIWPDRKRPKYIQLGFSKLIGEELKRKGFCGGDIVEAKLGILRIAFSKEPFPYPIYFRKDHRGALFLPQKFIPLIFNSSLPPQEWQRRKGSANWEKAHILLARFPLVFPQEPRISLKNAKFMSTCRVYINPRYHYAQLCFSKKTAQFFASLGIKGFETYFKKEENFLLLLARKNCCFSCQECPAVECFPLYYEKDGRARMSIFQLLQSVIPSKEISSLKGDIYQQKEERFLIKLELKNPQ